MQQRKTMLLALALVLTSFAGEPRADDTQTELLEMCGAFMLVSHDWAPQNKATKPMGDFLLRKAGELRGRAYGAEDVMRLKTQATFFVLKQVKEKPDPTEWGEQTGAGCAVLAFSHGYRGEQSAANPSAKHGNAEQDALARQLQKMPGVSRW